VTSSPKPWSPHDLGTGMLLEHPTVCPRRVGRSVHILRRLRDWQPGEMPYFEVRVSGEEPGPGCAYPVYPGDAIGEHVEVKRKKVVYLAHPLSAPTREGIEANRKNAARWAAWLVVNFDVAIECTWVVLTGELEETDDNRKLGLDCDLALVERCDELWMVGGRVSSGMQLESDHARGKGKRVVDLTALGRDVPALREVVELALQQRAPFRAGDSVAHAPSGETWVLATDQVGDDVVCAGWPESIARAADCTLVRAASDDERLKMLRDVAKDCAGQMRGRWAQRQLDQAQESAGQRS
jgi:hypothetical protein